MSSFHAAVAVSEKYRFPFTTRVWWEKPPIIARDVRRSCSAQDLAFVGPARPAVPPSGTGPRYFQALSPSQIVIIGADTGTSHAHRIRCSNATPRGVPSGHCSKKRKHQPRLQQSMQSVIRLVCRSIAGPCRGAFPPHYACKSTSDTFLQTGQRFTELSRCASYELGPAMQAFIVFPCIRCSGDCEGV